MSETELFGFGDALIGAEGGTNFATEANLTKHYIIIIELTAGHGARDGKTHGEIGGGIVDFKATNHVNKDVFVAEFELGAAFDYGN